MPRLYIDTRDRARIVGPRLPYVDAVVHEPSLNRSRGAGKRFGER
jgi:hypothetical protein